MTFLEEKRRRLQLKKEWHLNENYGPTPFKKLTKLEFTVEGMKDRNDAAWIQYNMLVNESIHRVHVEFITKKGKLLYNPLELTQEQVLELVPKPFTAKAVKEEEIEYEKLLASGYHLE